MAIDYIIDYDCVPKQTLATEGIVRRLKGRERAQTIIRLFRQNGDNRPPSQMGFEFTRSTPEGVEENRVIVVQDLLDEAAELDPLAPHCQGCPANVRGVPFGCTGQIQYPLTFAGEVWLLKQLPPPDVPLIWLLLRETVREMGYTGASVQPLRGDSNYFEQTAGYARNIGEVQVSSDQVFEMCFLVGHVQPSQAGALLLFFNGIERETLEMPGVIAILNRTLPPDELAAQYPFRHSDDATDDSTTADLKGFLRALHAAWTLNVRLLLDV